MPELIGAPRGSGDESAVIQPGLQFSETRDLLQFIREENEASRRSAADEAQATRAFLIDTVKLVSYPLTAIIAVAAFLGYTNLSSFEKSLRITATEQIKGYVQAQEPDIRNKVKAEVDSQFDLPTIRKTVEDEVSRSQAVNDAINNQIKKEIPQISHVANQVVQKATTNILEQARSQAPTKPDFGSFSNETIHAVAGSPIEVQASLRNIGQEDLVSIVGYGVVRLVKQPLQDGDRTRLLQDIAREVEKKRTSGETDFSHPGKLSWGQDFTLRILGPKLSVDDKRKLVNGDLWLYFVYFVAGSSAVSKTTSDKFFSGETTGDLKTIEHQNIFTYGEKYWNDIVRGDGTGNVSPETIYEHLLQQQQHPSR